jgi:hypothetical protein
LLRGVRRPRQPPELTASRQRELLAYRESLGLPETHLERRLAETGLAP